jgi:predicted ATP-grasp superfamily ATP-dependent carboligase
VNKPSYLVAASSGRTLAASAHRAGLLVHVVDLFADRDTRGAHTARVAGTLRDGFDPTCLVERIGQLRQSQNLEGLVVGSGFEDRPELLELLSEHCRLLGNPASTVRLVKDPAYFFGLLERLGIPYPETVQQPPADHRTGWLIKRIGAMGGDHIRLLKPGEIGKPGYYLQRYIEGRPYSVVFLADGKGARIIGYNELWQARGFEPTPFKYGGAVSLPEMDKGLVDKLTEAIRALVAAFELRGLCGLDLIVDADRRFYVLEINPRPPATFELHEGRVSLFQQHLCACRGRLPDKMPAVEIPEARAHAVLYAACPIEIKEEIDWPVWASDLPTSGTSIEQGAPVCTVHARARTPEHAWRLVIERLNWLESKLLWRAAAYSFIASATVLKRPSFL